MQRREEKRGRRTRQNNVDHRIQSKMFEGRVDDHMQGDCTNWQNDAGPVLPRQISVQWETFSILQMVQEVLRSLELKGHHMTLGSFFLLQSRQFPWDSNVTLTSDASHLQLTKRSLACEREVVTPLRIRLWKLKLFGQACQSEAVGLWGTL